MHMQLGNAALLIADVVRVLNPQSPQARAIFDLAIVVIGVMAVILAVVVGIVTYALFRFPSMARRRPRSGPGRGQQDNRDRVDCDPASNCYHFVRTRGAHNGDLRPTATA
jgi:heme/copper-type cytochrome/quinol oxidase subunit 2